MFKGYVDLCREEEFNFENFYKIVDNFKLESNLVLQRINCEGTKLIYIFSNENDRVWIGFDSRYKQLNLELETECSLENFNYYYNKLQKNSRSNL